MAQLNDTSALSRPISKISHDSKLLNRLLMEKEQRRSMSFPEAKALIIDELKRTKEQLSSVSETSGWGFKVARAKIDVINKHIPAIQKFKPEDYDAIAYALAQEIASSHAAESCLHQELMQVFYIISAAYTELNAFRWS